MAITKMHKGTYSFGEYAVSQWAYSFLKGVQLLVEANVADPDVSDCRYPSMENVGEALDFYGKDAKTVVFFAGAVGDCIFGPGSFVDKVCEAIEAKDQRIINIVKYEFFIELCEGTYLKGTYGSSPEVFMTKATYAVDPANEGIGKEFLALLQEALNEALACLKESDQ